MPKLWTPQPWVTRSLLQHSSTEQVSITPRRTKHMYIKMQVQTQRQDRASEPGFQHSLSHPHPQPSLSHT